MIKIFTEESKKDLVKEIQKYEKENNLKAISLSYEKIETIYTTPAGIILPKWEYEAIIIFQEQKAEEIIKVIGE